MGRPPGDSGACVRSPSAVCSSTWRTWRIINFIERARWTRPARAVVRHADWSDDGELGVASAPGHPEYLYALWDSAVARSRSAVADRNGRCATSVGGLRPRPNGQLVQTLRRLIVDMIEEYARHTGHADLIRESIDGRTGEDPPGPRTAFRYPLGRMEG